jgi:type IV pilus assembly protein PilO
MDIDVKDPRFIRWAVAILLVLILVPVFLMTTLFPFTYASRKAEIARLEQRHQDLSRDLEKARLLVRNLERVEQEYEILSQQWEVAQTLLPEENEMPNLLRKVTAAGTQSGVEFQLFRPQAKRHQAFYTDNPIEVKVQGGYHQTGVFLSRLANLNRIVNIGSLKMAELSDQEEQPFTVETSMVLTAYTLGGGPPPGDAATDGQTLANASAARSGGQGGSTAARAGKDVKAKAQAQSRAQAGSH